MLAAKENLFHGQNGAALAAERPAPRRPTDQSAAKAGHPLGYSGGRRQRV